MKKIVLTAFIFLMLFGCEDKYTTPGNPFPLTKEELKEYTKSTLKGDMKSAYILVSYYSFSDDHKTTKMWRRKIAEMGDLKSRFMEIAQLIDDPEEQKRLKQKWGMDDEKYFKSELSSDDIEYLIKKANDGDKLATYVLSQYYYGNNQQKYLYWTMKSANAGEFESKLNLLNECVEYPKLFCHKDVPDMIKKWEMEYFFPDYNEKDYSYRHKQTTY